MSQQYFVITAATVYDLHTSVAKYIAAGWKLQGGVCVSLIGFAGAKFIWTQAMIRDGAADPTPVKATK